jgi:hypothetical protein
MRIFSFFGGGLDGMIIFPASGVFADLGGMGVSMFFVTYVLLSPSPLAYRVLPLWGWGEQNAHRAVDVYSRREWVRRCQWEYDDRSRCMSPPPCLSDFDLSSI